MHTRKSTLRNLAIVTALIAAFISSYVWIIRPWEMRWGATDEEVNMSLPQDGRTDDVLSISTRAVTIYAPAATVWRWLIQTGENGNCRHPRNKELICPLHDR